MASLDIDGKPSVSPTMRLAVEAKRIARLERLEREVVRLLAKVEEQDRRIANMSLQSRGQPAP